MVEYKSKYKCRLCGEEYRNSVTAGSQSVVFQNMVDLCYDGQSHEILSPKMNEPHCCKYGGVGVADFMGWERVDNG